MVKCAWHVVPAIDGQIANHVIISESFVVT